MEKLTKKQLLLLASLIFGMFFGAGNLIFPAHLGQLAGEHWLSAGIGFLISATLIPLSALIALSQTRSQGIFDIAKPVAGWYGILFLILCHLALGPMFATPRTAALGYQFSFESIVPKRYDQLGLFLFSAAFFGLAYYFSIRETNLLKIIGKLLNPAFLIILFAIFAIAFIHPFGTLQHLPADQTYGHGSTIKGFLEGYNTMDALAALAFGVTIIRTIRLLGIKKEKAIASQTIKAGSLSMLLTAGIYLGIIALGAMSLAKFPLSDNGGIALTQIIRYYFGQPGMIVMGGLTILAVFTTAMGLIASFAQDFSAHFSILSYKGWLRLTTLLSFLTANFGLDAIIAWTMPFLMLLYPLAMALIIPGLFAPLFKHDRVIYRFSTAFAALPAIFDAIGALPIQTTLTKNLTAGYHQIIPFAGQGLGWMIPTAIGLGLAIVLHLFRKHSALETVAE